MRFCLWCIQLAAWIGIIRMGYASRILALVCLIVSGFFIVIDWAKTYPSYWDALGKKKRK